MHELSGDDDAVFDSLLTTSENLRDASSYDVDRLRAVGPAGPRYSRGFGRRRDRDQPGSGPEAESLGRGTGSDRGTGSP